MSLLNSYMIGKCFVRISTVGKMGVGKMGVGEMVRPGKLDLLFCISHLFDLRVGRQSLFIFCF